MDLGIAPARRLLTLKEASGVLDICENGVRNLVDGGWLVVRPRSGNPNPLRAHLSVERWSLEAYCLYIWARQGVDVSRFQQSPLSQFWLAELRKRKTRAEKAS